MRNDGNPGLATKAVLFGGIFNVFGDYFFVFALKMGIMGAGAIWFAMPLTELIVAVYVAMKMKQYTKQLPREN